MGAWTPSPEHATIAKRLLDHAESGMLPLYIAAVEGRREARVSMAYLHGTYEIKPWYKHIPILDAMTHCELSPLCKAAKGIRNTGSNQVEKQTARMVPGQAEAHTQNSPNTTRHRQDHNKHIRQSHEKTLDAKQMPALTPGTTTIIINYRTPNWNTLLLDTH